jgi:hypothetical protein
MPVSVFVAYLAYLTARLVAFRHLGLRKGYGANDFARKTVYLFSETVCIHGIFLSVSKFFNHLHIGYVIHFSLCFRMQRYKRNAT